MSVTQSSLRERPHGTAVLFSSLLALSGLNLWSPPQAFALEEIDESPSPSSSKAHGPFGVGLILGSPTALSAKYFFDNTSALQLHLGWSFGWRDAVVLIADYLFHFYAAIPPIEGAGKIAPYVGLGARIGVYEDDPLIGLRIPGGFSFMLNAAPIEIFIEVALGIGLYPRTAAFLDGGLGGRFYF